MDGIGRGKGVNKGKMMMMMRRRLFYPS